MKSITYYIVVHNSESMEKFIELNKNSSILNDVKFINVGDKFLYDAHIFATRLKHNIEYIPTLLTFTAYYALIKNNLIKTDYVGIFEYDTELNFGKFFEQTKEGQYLLRKKRIIGFNPRPVKNDPYYLDYVTGFTSAITPSWKFKALEQEHWNATTNVIMPVKFLKRFVDWYWEIFTTHKLYDYENHPHFHERAISIFAANKGYEFAYFPHYAKHHQLRSHKIELI